MHSLLIVLFGLPVTVVMVQLVQLLQVLKAAFNVRHLFWQF